MPLNCLSTVSDTDRIRQESLDELARLVAKFYSPVKNRGLDPLPKVPDDPYGKNELCVRCS